MRAGKVPPTGNAFWNLFVGVQCAFCPSKRHFTSKQLIEQQSELWTHQVSYWATLSGSIKLQTYNTWLVLWDKHKAIQTFLCFRNSLVKLLLSLAPFLPQFFLLIMPPPDYWFAVSLCLLLRQAFGLVVYESCDIGSSQKQSGSLCIKDKKTIGDMQ